MVRSLQAQSRHQWCGASTALLLFCLAAVLLLTGCARVFGRQIALDDTFALAPGEQARLAGGGLSLRLGSVGRDITEDGEIPYADVRVTAASEVESRTLYPGETLAVGDYVVTLKSVNPFNDPQAEFVFSQP